MKSKSVNALSRREKLNLPKERLLEALDLMADALGCALDVMRQEKQAWDGTCNTFDNAIEACENALK